MNEYFFKYVVRYDGEQKENENCIIIDAENGHSAVEKLWKFACETTGYKSFTDDSKRIIADMRIIMMNRL